MALFKLQGEEYVCTGCGASTEEIPRPGEWPEVVHEVGCPVGARRVDERVDEIVAAAAAEEE